MPSRDRASYAAVVGVMALAIALLGSGLRWPACVVAMAAVAAAVPSWRSSRRFEQPSPLLVLLLLMAAFTAFQLVPLPSAVVRVLSPQARAAVMDSYAVLGEEPPAFMPLSRDAPGTWLELAKHVSFACVAFVALRLSSSRRHRRQLLAAVALAGGGLAAIGLLHRALDLHQLFGLYDPQDNDPLFLTPLINPNHLAGMLALTVPIAGALAIEARGPWRMVWLACGLAATVVCLLTRSRGGAIALAVAVLIFAGLTLAGRWERGSGRRSANGLTVRGPAVGIALCALTLAVYFSASGVVAELSGTRSGEWTDPNSKFAAWRSAGTLLREHWLTGVGRGAFESVFPRVHEPSAFHTYSHVENEYLQVAIDWGAPAAIALAFVLAWLSLVAVHRRRDGVLAAGALGGLAGIGLQNFVDFSLEIPGVAIPVILVAATLTYPQLGMATRDRKARWVRVGAAAAAVIAVIGAVSPLGQPVRDARAELAEMPTESPTQRAAVVRAAKTQMRRHPSDYYAPARIAHASVLGSDPEGARYLSHALSLHPTHPGLHHLVARLLLRRGNDAQARIEYALAVRFSRKPGPLLDEILEQWADENDAALALPLEASRVPSIVRALRDRRRADVALAYVGRVVVTDPNNVRYLRLEYELALLVERWDRAATAARAAHRVMPSPASALALASALVEAGDLDAAEAALIEARSLNPSDAQQVEITSLLGTVQMRRENWVEARATLRGLTELPAVDRKTRRSAHQRLSAVERALGNKHQAEWEAARARDLRD